jgi:hypothetical protein
MDSTIDAKRIALNGFVRGMLETNCEALVLKTDDSTSAAPHIVTPLMNGEYPKPPKRIGDDNQSGMAISIAPCAPLQNARKNEMNARELTPTASVVPKLMFGSSIIVLGSGDAPTLRRT